MSGVATPDELRMIRELETKVDLDRSPAEELLRLAQLYIRPMFKEALAIPVLEKILERDPGNAWATYWLAYCHLHYGIDQPSLLKAKQLLESWLVSHECNDSNAEECAAVHELLVEVRDDILLSDISDAERVALLEESVRLAPQWSGNRWYLARAYIAVGRIEDAISQLEAAQANMIAADPCWDPTEDYFERSVTGRANYYLVDELPKMLQELRKRV